MNIRNLKPLALVIASFLASPLCFAQKAIDAGSGSNVVYRCPNNIYTNDPVQARANNCTVVQANISTIGEGVKPTAVRTSDAKASEPSKNEASRPQTAKTSSPEQKARDSDRRKILEDELKTSEDKLADLKKEYNNGEPERKGDERNFSKYQDRTNQLKADVTRAEADVSALRREIGNLKD